MTLEEFVKKEKENIKRFEKWWKEQEKKIPEHYPHEMEWGDWDEQYMLWER